MTCYEENKEISLSVRFVLFDVKFDNTNTNSNSSPHSLTSLSLSSLLSLLSPEGKTLKDLFAHTQVSSLSLSLTQTVTFLSPYIVKRMFALCYICVYIVLYGSHRQTDSCLYNQYQNFIARSVLFPIFNLRSVAFSICLNVFGSGCVTFCIFIKHILWISNFMQDPSVSSPFMLDLVPRSLIRGFCCRIRV